MEGAKTALDNYDKNLFYIDGSSLEFPHIDQGRNFEVRSLLDIERPSTINKFTRSLPKRFKNNLSFWKNYFEELNQSFCRSFDVRYSIISFSQVSDDQCTFFHSDAGRVRLFQTLQGPGTEYVSDDNATREGIGRGDNSKVVIDSSQVHHAQEKDILIMRGDKWFDKKGLVHRSPPIEHLGLKRLYLCIDAKKNLSEVQF